MSTNDTETAYESGARAVWLDLLRQALSNLGHADTEPARAAWVIERERAIAMMRLACSMFGDNDWDPKLSLADIIDKHLIRHLAGRP